MVEWRKVPDFPNYEVSNAGVIRSANIANVAQMKKATGYMYANLYNHGMKQVSVHRLVASVFIPNPYNLPQVNHINGIKSDNRVENLEWCTASQNARHAYGTGLCTPWNKGQHNIYSSKTIEKLSTAHKGKAVTCKPVLQYDLNGNLLNKWSSAAVAARSLGINRRHISKACNGIKYKTVGGFRWSFSV